MHGEGQSRSLIQRIAGRNKGSLRRTFYTAEGAVNWGHYVHLSGV
jgi:hypothetical protein